MIILGKLAKSLLKGMLARVYKKEKMFIDEPVVSHVEPEAADHSSVDWDVLFDPTQSSSGLSPGY